MLDENEVYVIETDGSIHVMNFVGDSDWDTKPTTSLQEIRNKVIDEFLEKATKIVYEANDRKRNPQPRDMTADIHYKLQEIAEQMKGGAEWR